MIARKKSWLDSESDDHANFSCGESEVTLQQYTADQEMYAISKNKKKQRQQRKRQQLFQAPLTHRQGSSLSVVEFLPGFLSHIIFNIFFPKNFQRWCLYCSYIIILDTKLFNVFAIFNLVSWQTSWRIALNDVKRILLVLFQMQNIESPPSAAYMKKKMLFCEFNHHFFILKQLIC